MRVCMTAVMMGDVGAVTVVQEAHTRLLLRSGVLSPETMVNSPFIKNPDGVQGDVYIDDLILMAVGSLCSPLELSLMHSPLLTRSMKRQTLLPSAANPFLPPRLPTLGERMSMGIQELCASVDRGVRL